VLYRLLADLTVIAHGAFVLWVAVGALAVWRVRWLAWLHLPAVVWGVLIELTGRVCPLTPLENRLRRLGGDAGYPGGFIEHYLVPVIYPGALERSHQWVLGLSVAAFNIWIYARLLRQPEAGSSQSEPPGGSKHE
jgi:hypothetical protein